MPHPRARIASALLLLICALVELTAVFVPWLQVDNYETTSASGVFHWQSSTPLSPLPDLFHGNNPPYVLGYPPSSLMLALVLFGPPALTILLALAAWFTARSGTPGSPQWLERACLGAGLLSLAQVGYVLALFIDPFHFHELGVLDEFITSVQPGLALALAASIGAIAAGAVLWLSRRSPVAYPEAREPMTHASAT